MTANRDIRLVPYREIPKQAMDALFLSMRAHHNIDLLLTRSEEEMVSVLSNHTDSLWGVYRGEELVGMFGIEPYSYDQKYWETSTCLIPRVRGTGLNRALKIAVVQALLGSNIKLCSHINDTNRISQRALIKAIPDAKVVSESGLVREGIYRWSPYTFKFYDLSEVTPKSIPDNAIQVAETLKAYAIKVGNQHRKESYQDSLVGNDGLTGKERKALADEYLRTVGRPFTIEDSEELKKFHHSKQLLSE